MSAPISQHRGQPPATTGPVGPGPGRRCLARAIYSTLWLAALPVAFAYLLWRSRRQPAYRQHWAERLGGGAPPDAPRGVLWFHLVSVGETRAAQPLVAALREALPDWPVLLTHATPTGRETGQALFGDEVARVYLPYDHPWLLRRFLRRYQPRLGIILETELWPNLVAEARRAGVPLALVNGRLSERSLQKGLRWPALIPPALRGLDLVGAQTIDDAQRLQRLGRSADSITGNIKFDMAPTPVLDALGRQWRKRLRRPVIMLASSRDGEEALVLQAWQSTAVAGADDARTPLAPLLCIVPRHPQRFEELATWLSRQGRLARRHDLDAATVTADLLLGDSMGEMAAYYAMTDVAILGGSLLPFGGQNLIEACAAGVPVILGPHTYNFAEAAEQALAAGAAIRVGDASEAVLAARLLVADRDAHARMSTAGRAFAEGHRGATVRTLEMLKPLLAAMHPSMTR